MSWLFLETRHVPIHLSPHEMHYRRSQLCFSYLLGYRLTPRVPIVSVPGTSRTGLSSFRWEDLLYKIVYIISCKEHGGRQVSADPKQNSYTSFSDSYLKRYSANNFNFLAFHTSQLTTELTQLGSTMSSRSKLGPASTSRTKFTGRRSDAFSPIVMAPLLYLLSNNVNSFVSSKAQLSLYGFVVFFVRYVFCYYQASLGFRLCSCLTGLGSRHYFHFHVAFC